MTDTKPSTSNSEYAALPPEEKLRQWLAYQPKDADGRHWKRLAVRQFKAQVAGR